MKPEADLIECDPFVIAASNRVNYNNDLDIYDFEDEDDADGLDAKYAL